VVQNGFHDDPPSIAEGRRWRFPLKEATHEKGFRRKGKLKARQYEKELARLHVEVVKLQEWVKQKGARVCVIFEGRDGAGKAERSRPSPSA